MRLIQLTQGKCALVDEEDFESLNAWKWYANRSDGKTFYAMRNSKDALGKPKLVLMHRIIIGAMPHQQVDHINHDGLDNRRSNLRLCTSGENSRNRRINRDNTSGFKGVIWEKNRQKFRAAIRANGKRYYLGYFECPEEAARTYDAAALLLHGQFACPNKSLTAEPELELVT